MNPHTGELEVLRKGEKPSEGFVKVPRKLEELVREAQRIKLDEEGPVQDWAARERAKAAKKKARQTSKAARKRNRP